MDRTGGGVYQKAFVSSRNVNQIVSRYTESSQDPLDVVLVVVRQYGKIIAYAIVSCEIALNCVRQ